MRSTAYGTITVWLTASAGGLLVLLVGRRVIRRIRKEPGRHSGTTTRTDQPLPTSPAAADPPEHQPTSPQPASQQANQQAANQQAAGRTPVNSPWGGPPGSIPLPSRPLPTRTGAGGHPTGSNAAVGHPGGPHTDNRRTDNLSRRTGDPFPVLPGPQRAPTDARTPRRIPPQNIGRHPAYEDLAPTDRFPATQQDRRADRSRQDGGRPGQVSQAPDNRDPDSTAQDSTAQDNRDPDNGAPVSRDPSHPHRSHQEPPHPDPRAAPRP